MKLGLVYIHEGQWERYERDMTHLYARIRNGTMWPVMRRVNSLVAFEVAMQGIRDRNGP